MSHIGRQMSQGEKNVQSERAWAQDPSLTKQVFYWLGYPAAWHIISPMVTKSELWHAYIKYFCHSDSYITILILLLSLFFPGNKPTPPEYDNSVMDMLKDHAKNKDRNVRLQQPALYT